MDYEENETDKNVSSGDFTKTKVSSGGGTIENTLINGMTATKKKTKKGGQTP